jgi:hypothetical protein
MLWMEDEESSSFTVRVRKNLDVPTIERNEMGMFSFQEESRGQHAAGGKEGMGTYDVDCPSVPVLWTESGKALGDLRPVLAPNFVPTCMARPSLVSDDHADVKVVRCMCAQGLDDGRFCQDGTCEKDGREVQEGVEGNDFFGGSFI